MSDEETAAVGAHDRVRPDPRQAADVSEQMRVRLAKAERLRAAGIQPYPVGYPRTDTIAGVRERHADLPADTATGERVGVTGRVMLYRTGGKLCFATIRDGSGDLQVMISRDRTGEAGLAAWKSDVDLGDHIGVTGEVITSRSGELSVLADSFAITGKSLRPLPDKHAGLTDPQSRVRMRYVDLIVNPAARQMAEMRAAVTRAIREELHAQGFLEAETPMLQTLHGGANARPFVTHINAYDMRLYLRIALELYLKRLVVGGLEKVYEIGRNFRNEGADATHNPEFTMLEAYEAYGDYHTIAELTRSLILRAAHAGVGGTVIQRPGGVEHDIGGEWPWISVHEAISRALGEEVTAGTTGDELRKLAAQADIAVEPSWNAGQVLLELYEHLVEARTVLPTFYRDFPVEVSPLTRAHRTDPGLAERWDLVAFGAEIGTGYSELVDPLEQRARLTAQSLLAAGGDAEAMQLDEDFLRALEYGMPPSGGMGVGLDRILIMLTGASIRETILFPIVRPAER
ncbi:MAG TPA: bifunctional lysylphosphatidylglycerol synthetase/lysine--tRNA ligase LysX [Streptosporangiaceae bacterium]|nr:bifunctional lysylphosphatidylglycerol synthetase/lysine--tRNA ligase LysX [Streptosporangiaceae bacterium]